MFSNKGEINQVFVYVFSIIIVGFAGFLVIQFLGVFTQDTQDRTNIVFFQDVEIVYDEVARNWNSEKLQEFRVTGDIEYVCFFESECNTQDLQVNSEVVDAFIESNENIALFSSENNPEMSGSVGEFEINDRCECVQPTNGIIELFLINQRNEIKLEILE